MATVGFKPVEYGKRVNLYDGLIMRLSAEGKAYFNSQDIQEICEREGLWQGTISYDHSAPTVGVRSFRRFTDHLEDETIHLLDLLRIFDGRHIRLHDSWNSDVAPAVQRFVNGSVIPLENCRIHLDCHGSIAFATGYELDPKSGIRAAPIQKTAEGKQIWTIDSGTPNTRTAGWKQSELQINSQGVECGVALSVTHAISEDVAIFATNHLPRFGRLLSLAVKPQIGPTSVRGGPHAWRLAEESIKIIRSWSGYRERKGPLHLFFAAPNGLAFFIGRLARSLGPIHLYEHDFESGTPGAYQAAISLPS